MIWNDLNEKTQLDELIDRSNEEYVCIFKHSTRCHISAMVKSRLESSSDEVIQSQPFFLINVLKNRTVSDQVASTFDLIHESPQLLVLKNRQLIHHSAHTGITADRISQVLSGNLEN